MKKALNNGLSKAFAFLQRPVTLPSLGGKKKRRHTHYHYSHKRAKTAKTDVSHKEVHIYATTKEEDTEQGVQDMEKEEAIETDAPALETSEEPAKPAPAPEAFAKAAIPALSVSLPGKILMPKEKKVKGPGAWSVLKSRLTRPITLPHFFMKKPKVMSQPAPVLVAKPVAAETEVSDMPRGKIIDPEKGAAETKAEIAAKTAAIENEDGWMQKVKLHTSDHASKKWNAWGLIKERLFQPVEMPSFMKNQKEAPAAKPLTKEEMANDSFLRRVQSKNVNDPVGTRSDMQKPVTQASAAPASTLASFASDAAAPAVSTVPAPASTAHILPPLEKKKDEPAAIRREEPVVAETKKEEAKPAEAKPVPKIVIQKKSSALSNYIASLNYMGLGKERMMFIQNMATMLNAGLPLLDALRTILLETRNKAMKKLLQQILVSVENGSSFWRAMDDRHFFSLHAIALVRIGEESGSLAENMGYLAQQEEKDHELKGKVKMAMIYPSIVMTIMFILVIGLGWFVLPNLIGVLYSLGVPLPFVTRAVIAFTNFFTNYGTVAVPGFLVAAFVMVILNKTTRLKVVFQWIMFRIPGVGILAREATIARFGVILGGLLKAGVPVIESVQSLIEVTPIVAYRNLYTRMLEHITIGDSFSKSFQSIKGSDKLLPPSVQQLVVTGEKSGSLADIMLKVADIYDKKASETAQKLPVVLEPMILLFIGGLVGTIAFAIIVPIYGIVGSVGR